jgi:hypothetical protein
MNNLCALKKRDLGVKQPSKQFIIKEFRCVQTESGCWHPNSRSDGHGRYQHLLAIRAEPRFKYVRILILTELRAYSRLYIYLSIYLSTKNIIHGSKIETLR